MRFTRFEPRPRHRFRQAPIEQLEGRVLLAKFANGIDSDNLGEGIWAWGLQSSMANLGYKSGSTYNYSGFFNYVHNTQGAQYIIIKAADGGSVYDNPAGTQSYTTAVRNAAHAAGLKIFPYFYIRGTDEATEQAEISVFNNIVNTVGADGVVFDIEGDWDNFTTTHAVNTTERDSRIVEYFNGIGKSQNEDGSGANDSLFMAYSSFPYVSFHSEDPFLKLGDYCDAAMPQAYWATLKTSPSGTHSPTPGQSLIGTGGPTRMVADVDSEYRMTSLQSPAQHTIFFGHPESVKPVIMTGQMYGSTTTAADETEFYNAVISDTNAIGNGQVAGYRYKSVNFFDEDTAGVTTAAQMAALNTLHIGDAPGTPSTPSPADTVYTKTTTPALDWADVVNTYTPPTTGAATSYSVFIDGVLKTTTTSSNYTPSALGQGMHTWQIVANDIIGSTNGPTWHFTVDTIAPTIASESFQKQQVSPPYLSFTFSEAVSSVDSSDVTFTNLNISGGPVASVGSVASVGGNTYRYMLATNLPDGNFQATVSSPGITDAAGNPLGGTRVFTFSFLRGDADGNGTVNALDFNALANHYGTAGLGMLSGDFNFDGTVTSQDFAALAANFGKTLPAASQIVTEAVAMKYAPPVSLFSSQPLAKSMDLLDFADPLSF
jgi:hypothetical protein